VDNENNPENIDQEMIDAIAGAQKFMDDTHGLLQLCTWTNSFLQECF
jgi:hypothetical protein